jgi:peptide/nickel transport system substrate-binding protein
MFNNQIGRREFLKITGGTIGASLLAGPGALFAAPAPGALVDPMKILTSTATMDPVLPEVARVCAEAFKKIGWDVAANPVDYNQNVQKVVMEHDYDMWFVMLSGSALRIDPNVFLYHMHHSSQFKKGGYNWEGFSDPNVDRLVEAQQKEMDIEKRRQIANEAQVLCHEAQSNNVIAYMQMTTAYRSDRIKNVVPMLGEGTGSFWTDINMEVIKGDGYVRTARATPLKKLNPVAAKDTSEFMELRMIYDTLFRIGPDGSPMPWAAESHKMIDPTTIDLTIRKNMQWHDGEPLTAEDVKFTFDYSTKWKAPFFNSMLQKVDNVEVTGKHGVRIKLKESYSPLISNLLGGLFLIPKHIWKDIPEKVDVDDPMNFPNETPVGSGPFKFDYWDRGREMKVSAFKHHFNPPKCAGIIGTVYGSHDAIAAAIEKGECDRNRYILKPSLFQDLAKIKGVVAKGYPNHGFYNLSYNCLRAPLNDPQFRKALAHVIPKDLIIEAVLSGLADVGSSVIAPANKFWHNPAVNSYPNDIVKAKDILAKAGYTWDKKGNLHYPG